MRRFDDTAGNLHSFLLIDFTSTCSDQFRLMLSPHFIRDSERSDGPLTKLVAVLTGLNLIGSALFNLHNILAGLHSVCGIHCIILILFTSYFFILASV